MSEEPQTAGREPSLVSHVRAVHGPGLQDSVDRLVEPFGGWAALAAPGERIAVKINLLRGAPPEKAVSTHPETLRCVLRALKEAGDEVASPAAVEKALEAFLKYVRCVK